MGRTVSIGAQGFEKLRKDNCFYVDKTDFIRQWWESRDDITLITRPRRFGKTLNMNMLECFFSTKYAGRADLFEGLNIWKEEKYRDIQGTWPVIFLSFASIKANSFKGMIKQTCAKIYDLYRDYRFLFKSEIMEDADREYFLSVKDNMEVDEATYSINRLCGWLSLYYKKNVIVLLDEYDTPMQEAWLSGYLDEVVSFMRNFFNATFKTNPYLERAIMTGITRVSKESIFSDLNNLKVVTTTGNLYADCFGFTEKEVFDALDEMELSSERDKVKARYDGFTFGKLTDIYNPWSITNFLDERRLGLYWADTSGNGLVSSLIQKGNKNVKQTMEDLLEGKTFKSVIDEQIVFNRLDGTPAAIWSLLLAAGYLKVVTPPPLTGENDETDYIYELAITNKEVRLMFDRLIRDWFSGDSDAYNDFINALLKDNLREMNLYMKDIALDTISYFDSGNSPSEKEEPERFYHGFVLGLLVDLRGRYEVKSNRESGYGRYDVMLIPSKQDDPGIVMEFKVFDSEQEKDMKETVSAALAQIEEKKYAAELEAKGIAPERIRKYGFAFEGKDVLIG